MVGLANATKVSQGPLSCSVLTDSRAGRSWPEGEHSLCSIDLNCDGHIGTPQDVSIDPHRSPDPASLSQLPKEVQGGAYSLEAFEVQFDACRNGAKAGELEVGLLRRKSWEG